MAIAVAPPLMDDCPFRCLGCDLRNSPAHESEAITEHMRLLLRAVVTLQRRIGPEVVPDVALSPRRSAAGAVTVPVPELTAASSSKATAGDLLRTSSSALRPGAISDTGQCDLLRLLQGSEPSEDHALRQAAANPVPALPPKEPPSPKSPPQLLQSPAALLQAATLPLPNSAPSPLETTAVSPAKSPAEAAPRAFSPARRLAEVEARSPGPRTPSPAKSMAEADAHRTLNVVAKDLQDGKLSHADAADNFTQMISALPPGKLRCSALLNRAHCLVGLGRYSAALADVDAIVNEETPGVDAAKWHKVWLSRGGIHRKLAQASGQEGDPVLYAKARADYEHVLSIEPSHESSAGKARRCLEQLAVLEHRAAGCHLSAPPAPGEQGPEDGPGQGGDDLADQPTKRRRRDSDGGGEPHTAAVEANVPVAGTFDTAFAHRSLQLLGRDCTAAGRLLFEEGAVCERTASAGVAAGVGLSPPKAAFKRIFDIRSPAGGPREVVTLAHDAASSSRGTSSAEGRPHVDTSECTCHLRGHCKHLAAVLMAIEREVQSGDSVARACPEALERRLEAKTIEELKSYLRLNNQLLGGTKAELLRRVADGVIFGAVPQCPNCAGHLHQDGSSNDSSTVFRCKKLKWDRETCGYEVRAENLARRPFVGAEQLR